MKRISPKLAICVIMVCFVADALRAQTPRRRTFTFDLQKKQWEESPAPSPGTPEAELFEIREDLSDQAYKEALAGVERFVSDHNETHSLYPDALIARAEALIGLQEYDQAHETLQEFLNEFAGIALTAEALRLEFVIAEAYLGGAKRKLLGMRIMSGEDVAMEILDDISINYPGTDMAELAYKTKADFMFASGDHALAELEYGRLLREYPQSRYHQYALRRAADSALASFGGVEYDEAALIEAYERFNEYGVLYSRDAEAEGVSLILDDINEKRAEKEFLIAQYYEQTNHLSSAVFYYRLVAIEWKGTLAASKAAARLEVLSPMEARVPVEGTSPDSVTENIAP